MIGLGLASSHAPVLFAPADRWPLIYDRIPAYMKEAQPHTAKLETPEVIEGYKKRIDDAFALLRGQIEAYRPDALIMVGDDQGDMFDKGNNPPFYIYTGDSAWALDGGYWKSEEERNRLEFPCHGELARFIHKGLMKRGIELASGSELLPRGRPERGMSHMVASPLPVLCPQFDVPVVPIFLNEYFPPMPTADRCLQLGVALRELLADRPERIAIYASGGLSHDPNGPRAGWIDEPLDRWVLERLERNDTDALKHLFTFDSDTMRAGTGEIRAWITVAGAMQWPAKAVEYIAAHHGKTGLAFAYWPSVDALAAEAESIAAAVPARSAR